MTANGPDQTPNADPQHPYDAGYTHLFSHPPMMEDLLCGFVEAQWVQELNFSSLDKMSSSFVSDDLKHH